MADTKFSQFAPGGNTVPTDKIVGLRAGVNTIFDALNLLRSGNNLSDVANTDTSRNNLNAPKRSSGSGSPQGIVAGALGDLYIDTAAPTDKFYVCILAGTALTATWQVQTNLAGALLIANNLSDVANPVTSLSNIGGQPITIVGSGDPNGSQAGTAGQNFYFDTSTIQLWICTQTGTSATAVWAIQNQQGGGIDTINLSSMTPAQMLSNKLYIGVLASPGPAVGIMPIAPTAGDILIIYSAAAAGVTIQKGTAAIINITNNLVVTDLFIPFRNTLVLRCSNSASGGQWFSESIDDTVIIDGTTTVGYQPLNIVGSGDPNSNQAGVAGVNFYFDTSTSQIWICTQTGNAATAVWALQNQNEGGIEKIDLVSTTPAQMLTNTFYVGVLASPGPAVGIMPVSPTAGDVLIIYAAAAQGVTIQKGTAGLIEISGNLVSSSFFLPLRSNAVLRCFNSASGGQWFLESMDGPTIIDGTITVASQPINITGSGDPNGSHAGTQGVNFYFDTSQSQLWICTQTGNAVTAVWEIQNERGVETIDLVSTTPAQMMANKFYVGTLASPAPAVGIMPIAPTAGDVLYIYAPASQGVTVQRGTAALIEITGNLVSSSFFIPQRSNAVLRCFTAASGGQWFLESSDGPLVIDGTITVAYQPINITGSGDPNGSVAGTAGVNFYFDTSTEQLWRCTVTGNSATAVWVLSLSPASILPSNVVYISDSIGSDSTGNGTQAFPFETYNFAATYAAGLASINNQYGIFPIGNETVVGDITLYPFVNFVGLDPNVNSLNSTGSVVLDSSWDTTTDPIFTSNCMGISALDDFDIVFTVPQQAQILFYNTNFKDTPTINLTGTDSSNVELCGIINCINTLTNVDIVSTNITTIIDNSAVSNVTSINNSSSKQSILALISMSILINGTVTIQTVAPGLASALVGVGTKIANLTIDGTACLAQLDAISYTPTITFLNGADLTNVDLTSTSDGINASLNFVPSNYSPTGTSDYRSNSITGHLTGIDNELGTIATIAIQDIAYADITPATDVSITAGTNSQLLFDRVIIDQSSAYNTSTSTYTVPRDGTYEIMYTLQSTGTGGVGTNNYHFDSAVYINATFVNSGYISNRNSLVAASTIIRATNAGFMVIELTTADTVNVRGVNNGNIDILVQNTNLGIKYIGP
jgi:predicted small integral membrane protein